MKKLILLLLFIPFVASSQIDFDFDDIKNINSLKLFKKFCFENNFVKVAGNDDAFEIRYAYSYDKNKNEANIWAYYYPGSETFYFQFVKNYDDSSNKSFEDVLNQVKKQCEFYDFKLVMSDDYILYTCPNSSYKGKIGFLRGTDGSDYIQTFNY